MRTFTQLRPAIMFVIATLICLSAIAADQVVTSNADDGSGSLRQAINNVSPGGNITFNLPGGSETITIASELAITKGLTINGANTAGSGTAVTIQVTTPGTSAWRVFEISASGSTINLQNMALQGGDMGVYYGGAIQINAEATVNLTGMNISNSLATNGGGIFIAGSSSTPTNVTVTSSTFNGNSASNRGGGINVSYYANLTINSCTFINNTSGGNGGAIFDGGMVTITKSTFSENNGWYGGAICNFSSTTLTVVSSTISGNVCGASSNGGGGIYSEGSCYLLNSIVINNTPTIQSGADITIGGSGSTFAYYSWYSSTSGTINTQASAPNVTTAYTPGDLVALANNGGPTKTMALSASSPAKVMVLKPEKFSVAGNLARPMATIMIIIWYNQN